MKKDVDYPAILTRLAKEKIKFCVRKNRLYQYNGSWWNYLLEGDAAILLRKLVPKSEMDRITLNDIKESYGRLLQAPELQLEFTEDNNENYVNVINGVFDVENGQLIQDRTGFNFSYFADFTYTEMSERQMPYFETFVKETFEEEAEVKRKLLLQILGYCISDYTRAKTGFFLIGASNSGKSLLLEQIKRILPEKSITEIPLYRLENRFNLARLSESRLNINSELSEKSFKALDIFKMLTSNETITAEHKGQKPFEFRIRCKSLNAGNMLPDIEKLEGMNAIINRMTILLFTHSVPEEKKDLELPEKIWAERDSIFSTALDELVELHKNNFVFAEPEDTKRLKLQILSMGNAFDDFLEDCCLKNKNVKEHMTVLYDEFKRYCERNLLDVKITRNQFGQKLVRIPGVFKGKFRINGSSPAAGVIGIGLKHLDSNFIEIEKNWNTGTLEQADL